MLEVIIKHQQDEEVLTCSTNVYVQASWKCKGLQKVGRKGDSDA